MTRTSAILLIFAVTALSACREPPPERGYAGTWVTTLGTRVFVVLTLERRNSDLTGTLSMPKELSTADGTVFTNIGRETASHPLERASIDGEGMELTFTDPANPGAPDRFQMTLTGDNRASLKMLDVPIDIRFPLTRHAGSDRPAVAADWDSQASYRASNLPEAASPELQAIYEADQKVRQGDFAKMSDAELEAMSQGDARRRNDTRALLDTGKIQTGPDFRKAAFIFQHGDTPDDFLLAHTLALVALAKGDTSAAWIAAATLDRYLRSVKRPQIYGTQFDRSDSRLQTDSRLIPDALRSALGVPALVAPPTPQ